MGTIALLTDYGLNDGFVGMLKGAIKTVAPATDIIDITHHINSFDIRSAAFLLEKSYRYFPPATVFLVVVDPGVGTERRLLAAAAGGYTFVAPDNGVLSSVLAQFDKKTVHSVGNEVLSPQSVGATFHGRDIMAPIAAQLAQGTPLSGVGPMISSYAILPQPSLLRNDRGVIGEIVYVDKFGNLISNITRRDLPSGVAPEHLRCTIGPARDIQFVASYAAAVDLAAIISGFDTVEIFVNQGSAAARFAKPVGMTLAVEAVA
ncbi:MAG: SAM-dependent chlorinase/fluorinase [candidate division Zixibacteria bacterium]|nr:SAM-dependent chlorinase/fluorinase [candidate division Zixibacteria bacterium]